MKSIILGIVATVVLAVVASYGLSTLQQSATERYTAPASVRISTGS
jgi:ABC-type proline/glycine betaine transport system permease subunit